MKYRIIKQFITTIALLLLIITIGVTTQYAQKSKTFQGTWSWEKGTEQFELELKQNGNKLTGYHIAIGQNGSKVDEADTTQEPSIVGTVKRNTAKVNFKSGFPDSNGKGAATLILRRRQLYWKIINSSGEHYLPLSAVLKIKK